MVENNEKYQYVKLIKFITEIIVGSLLFVIVAGVAIALSLLVGYLKSNGYDQYIVMGIQTSEYIIFICDMLLFFRFMWCAYRRAWREL
ncbi:hypothetical protein O5O45_16400 [Hahella aquimaris]|uniref:hypothetical protein n=1 Tax=Hahella sp. HNIBRBA332 TaxID=3015983 RepID=UPI00273AFAEC|nr:hypothetical protein [Hahella sp. HNIBRBA332]WLQ11327.1 hypothetical protein O5O45_16400 [Hahella sp. HNIBRBA332]